MPGAPSQGYRRLALATAFATFLLIILGGIVRVSDSGLGCGPGGSGFHGWPLCKGDVVPGLDLNSVIEYSHRTVASIVGVMFLALAVLAWRRHREHRGIVKASIAAGVLVIAQGLLGAATVEENLDEELVAAHLGLAMLLLALIIYIWRASKPEVIGKEPPRVSSRINTLSVAAPVLILCTIVAGGYMAGTQKYGRPDYQLGDGAHHACGKEFPTCNGDFLPFGTARLVDIHLTHRVFMYIASIVVLWLAVAIIRSRPSANLVRIAWTTAGLLVAQLLVGALNVWLEEYEVLIVLHLTIATLIWGVLVALWLELRKVPAPAVERARRAEPEAVAA